MLPILRRLLPLFSLSMLLIASAKAQTSPTTPNALASTPPTLKIVTVAGNIYQGGESGDGGPATDASLSAPYSIKVDTSGNIFILDDYGIRKVTVSTGIISSVSWPQQAPLHLPASIAVDASDSIYVTEGWPACDIRKLVPATGSLSTISGQGYECGLAGIGVLAVNAAIDPADGDPPYLSGASLITDSRGNLYFPNEYFGPVLKITAANGIITAVAGGGDAYADGVYATDAALIDPSPLAVDSSGNLYIAEVGNNRIRKVDIATRHITTIAGNGTAGFAGDGGLAINAQLSADVEGLAVDKSGNVYISDSGNARIREVSASTGIITTIAGTGATTVSGDKGPAIDAGLGHPGALVIDAAGSLFFADYVNGLVREISVTPYQFDRTTLVPEITPVPYQPFDSPQTVSINDNDPGAVIYYTIDGSAPTVKSAIYSVPFTLSTTTKVSAIAVAPGLAQSAVASVTYTFVPPPAQLPAPQFSLAGGNYPGAVYVTMTDEVPGATIVYTIGDGSGNGSYYTPGQRIRIGSTTTLSAFAQLNGYASSDVATAFYNIGAASTEPEIVTVAGKSGSASFTGDGMIATAATLNAPDGVAVNKAGDIFISDAKNGVIRKVAEATGIITTLPGLTSLPGSTQFGGTGDSGPASVAVDASGNIYLADTYPQCDVRKVDASTGAVTTIAGLGYECGDSGDGGLAVNATISGSSSTALATDLLGNVYISEPNAQVVRKVTAATGVITRVAGTYGVKGFAGDGSPATSAELSGPSAIAVDINGNLYIADTGNNRIRKVNISTRAISTVAGNGTPGFSGDGGPATDANLSGYKDGLTVDRSGNIYIADSSSARIREVSAATGVITTIAGTGSSLTTGDQGPALRAGLGHPGAMTVDASGSLFYADPVHNVIREVSVSPKWYSNPTLPPNFSPNGGGFLGPQQVSITPTQAHSVIYYTTDGSSPTTKSLVYTGPIMVSATEVIAAIAMAPGFGPSPVVQASITILPAEVTAPKFSPAGGKFTGSVQVSITDATSAAQIHYTTDGSTPTSSSTIYSGPVTFNATTTVKAIAVVLGQVSSDVATATYTAQPLAVPTIYPAPGTYKSPQTVVITDAAPGATIYCSVVGNPMFAGNVFTYTGPVLLSQSETISAYAVVGGVPSDSVSATYEMNVPSASLTFPSNSLLYGSFYSHGGAGAGGPNLQLVDGGPNEATSVWYNTLLYTGAFTTDFTFQTNPANGNGFAFVLQNQGLDAVGKNGSGLGYEGIGKSVAIKFDFFNSDGQGNNSTGLYLNGAAPTVPATDLTPSGIDFHSNSLKSAHLVYDGTTLTVTITDKAANASATQSYKVNIPAIVGGNSAYAGFTAGTSSVSSNIVVEKWNFTPPFTMAQTPSPAPVILPGSGTYQNRQTVTMQDANSNAVIYYMFGGSAPGLGSPVYDGPLDVSSDVVFKVNAIVPGYAPSDVVTITYTQP